MKFKGQACHKLILAGEHLVVHGYQGLAVPLLDKLTICTITDNHNKIIFNNTQLSGEEIMGFRNEMQLFYHLLGLTDAQISILDTFGFEFDMQADTGVGLGSSASFALAIIRALASFTSQELSIQEQLDLVGTFEKIYHGNPSGIDHTTIVLEKPILWKGKDDFEPLDLKMPPFWSQVQIENSGKPAESTKEMIEYFATKFHGLDPAMLNSLNAEIPNLIASLQNNDLAEFKRIINLYGQFLESIPLCTPSVIAANQKIRQGDSAVKEHTTKLAKGEGDAKEEAKVEGKGKETGEAKGEEKAKSGSFGAAKICGAGGLTAGSGIVLSVK